MTKQTQVDVTWAAWVAYDRHLHRAPLADERSRGHRMTETLEHAFDCREPGPGDRPICGARPREKGMKLRTGVGYLRRCHNCIRCLGFDRDEPFMWPAKNGNGWLFVAPRHDPFIEALKERVPPDHRAWFPRDRRWWIATEYVDDVREIAETFFESVAWPRSEARDA